MDTKTCKKCGYVKELSFFVKNSSCKNGYSNTCKLCKNKYHKKWRVENPEQAKKTLQVWRKNNPEHAKQIQRNWKAANKEKISVFNAKTKAIRKNRFVSWDVEFSLFVTEEAHSLRNLRNKTTGIFWHVDHIIPLKGKNVSGLHVWNNLQVIPAIENLRKNNLYET